MLNSTNKNEWQKEPIDYIEGGKIFENWLYEAKEDRGNLLVICGAGISMDGAAPGASGFKLGEIFENYLRDKNGSVPPSNGDIAKAYDYYCYGKAEDINNPIFDPTRHEEFVSCISASQFFTGAPNYEHLSLDKEVRSSDKIRVYSINVDQFFEQAAINPSLSPWVNITTNANSLKGLQSGCNKHREWRILAAHGKTNDGPSVWSDTVLSNPLSSVSNAYINERSIVEAAIECIKNGPLFKHIIFAGICAPLVYLMEPLGNKLIDNGIKWMWVNPFDPPQDWLLNEAAYNETNGDWAKTTFKDICYYMHLNRYIKWFNNSCNENTYNYDDICEIKNGSQLKTIVKSIHRARRIFKDGAVVLNDASTNPDRLQSYHQCVEPYNPPITNEDYVYEDSSLAQTLKIFCEKGMRLTADPGDKYPKCSIAIKDYNAQPVSLQMIKIGDRKVEFKNIAQGINESMSECFWNDANDPDLHHFVVIDSLESDVQHLNQEFGNIQSIKPNPKCMFYSCSEIKEPFPGYALLGGRPARP